VGMAKDNRSWDYDRIVGALANLGYRVSGQTVSNVLRGHGIAPSAQRKRTTTWAEFIRRRRPALARSPPRFCHHFDFWPYGQSPG
jgi:putative transposase